MFQTQTVRAPYFVEAVEASEKHYVLYESNYSSWVRLFIERGARPLSQDESDSIHKYSAVIAGLEKAYIFDPQRIAEIQRKERQRFDPNSVVKIKHMWS